MRTPRRENFHYSDSGEHDTKWWWWRRRMLDYIRPRRHFNYIVLCCSRERAGKDTLHISTTTSTTTITSTITGLSPGQVLFKWSLLWRHVLYRTLRGQLHNYWNGQRRRKIFFFICPHFPYLTRRVALRTPRTKNIKDTLLLHDRSLRIREQHRDRELAGGGRPGWCCRYSSSRYSGIKWVIIRSGENDFVFLGGGEDNYIIL